MKIDDAKLRSSVKTGVQGFAPKRVSAFFDQTRTEIVYLDVGLLVPYSKQARRFFDDAEIDKLAETIKEHGIRQPLTVHANLEGTFEVVSGERRLRAAKKLGLAQLPCIVLKDMDKVEEIALVENIQRKDLHPVELANALSDLIQKRGWGGQTEVARQLGMGTSQVSELLKLTTLESEVQEVLIQKNLRGREQFRKIQSLSSLEKRLSYINSFDGPKEQRVHTKESVLRVYLEGDTVHLQANKLKHLSQDKRSQILLTLQDLIRELES